MHKNKLYCRTYLQHENYTNTILKSWGWGSGAMVVVSSMLGVGCAGGRHRQRWWGDGVGGGLSMPGVGCPGGRRQRRWWVVVWVAGH